METLLGPVITLLIVVAQTLSALRSKWRSNNPKLIQERIYLREQRGKLSELRQKLADTASDERLAAPLSREAERKAGRFILRADIVWGKGIVEHYKAAWYHVLAAEYYEIASQYRGAALSYHNAAHAFRFVGEFGRAGTYYTCAGKLFNRSFKASPESQDASNRDRSFTRAIGAYRAAGDDHKAKQIESELSPQS